MVVICLLVNVTEVESLFEDKVGTAFVAHYSSVAVVADDTGTQDRISKCPFIQHNMKTESGREDALDLAFTAQAVLRDTGIVFD